MSGKVVVDVGCNDGSLLNYFSSRDAITIGIEPTDAAKDINKNSHLIYNTFFDIDTAREINKVHPKIDIITFTNVFAHIENLPALLSALKCLMSPETLLVIENHYLGAILGSNQFDTFYHEHPRTYSLTSFLQISKSLDRKLSSVEFPKRYGGNIRVFISNQDLPTDQNDLVTTTLQAEANYKSQFTLMSDFIDKWKISKLAEINAQVTLFGPLAAKAFPGRAAILIKLLNLNEHHIECIYEQPSSPKIGHYVPGTKIPIRSDLELFERLPDMPCIINFAWHIKHEIKDYLQSAGYGGLIVDIL